MSLNFRKDLQSEATQAGFERNPDLSPSTPLTPRPRGRPHLTLTMASGEELEVKTPQEIKGLASGFGQLAASEVSLN